MFQQPRNFVSMVEDRLTLSSEVRIEWKVLVVSLRAHEVARVTLVSLHNNASALPLPAVHVHSYSGRAAR